MLTRNITSKEIREARILFRYIQIILLSQSGEVEILIPDDVIREKKNIQDGIQELFGELNRFQELESLKYMENLIDSVIEALKNVLEIYHNLENKKFEQNHTDDLKNEALKIGRHLARHLDKSSNVYNDQELLELLILPENGIEPKYIYYFNFFVCFETLRTIAYRLKINLSPLPQIKRNIFLDDENKSAGLSMVNYFIDFFNKKKGGVNTNVTVEQDGTNVKIIIEYPFGHSADVKSILAKYSDLVNGKVHPDDIFTSEADKLEFKNKIFLVLLELESSKKNLDIGSLDLNQISHKLNSDLNKDSFSPNLLSLASRLTENKLRVFVSYSREDSAFYDKLLSHLNGIRDVEIRVWTDRNIQPGSNLKEQMIRELDEADAVILMVSHNFYSSDFIQEIELPKILGDLTLNRKSIIPVIVTYCNYELRELGQFASVNDPNKPLQALTENEQNKIFTDVIRELKRLKS